MSITNNEAKKIYDLEDAEWLGKNFGSDVSNYESIGRNGCVATIEYDLSYVRPIVLTFDSDKAAQRFVDIISEAFKRESEEYRMMFDEDFYDMVGAEMEEYDNEMATKETKYDFYEDLYQ